MTFPVPEKISEHYDPIECALSDIGHALGLLNLLVEEVANCIPEDRSGQMFFLIHSAWKLQENAEKHLAQLWLAVGGRSA